MKKYQNLSRVIALALVLAVLLPCISMTARSTDIPCAEDGCSGKYLGGICSAAGHYEAAPLEGGSYRISNAGQLYWFAALVNSGENEYGGGNGEVYNAVLTADITINADMEADGKLRWTPIGLYTSAREFVRYSGTFDGAGYTIYGVYYDNTGYEGRNAGLFGMVDENGTVKNLTLADSVIHGATEIGGIAAYNYGTISGCTQAGAVTGTGAAGGIVCRNLGLIERCVNSGSVSGATTGGIAAENSGEVLSCTNSGAVSGTSSVGGIAGMNDGLVADSRNTAAVTASGTHAGGVAGNCVGGDILRCGNSGSISGASDYIGGVAGVCSGAAITESYNTGKVSGNSGKSDAVGGVVGAIDGTNTDDSAVTSCYNTGKVEGRSWVGGIAGISGYQKTPKTVTFRNSYNTGAVSGTAHVGAVVGRLSKGTASGIYYLEGTRNAVSGATAATAGQFASGEIAARLNEVSNVWYQALDKEGFAPDASPVLDPEHGVIYEGYCNCTEMGYTNRENYNEPGDHVDEDWNMICDKCAAILGEAHEHEFGAWSRTREPSCSEFGEETRICSVCTYPQKRRIEKLPHTEEIIPGVSATFDESGLTDGKRCTVCGEVTVPQTEAPVHDYNAGIIPLNVLTVSAGDWQTGYESSEGPAALAVDNDLNTLWHTDWYGTSRENHWFQFEITGEYAVTGLRYKPRVTGNTNGTITRYEILVSDDGVSFTSVASGNWADNRNWKVVEFDATNVRFVRLVAVDAVTDNAYVFASAAEIRLTGYQGEAHLHSYEAVVTAPTCTEGGYTTYTCECGDSYTADETAPLGHSWKGVECERCDETRENPFVDVPNDSFCIDPVLWAVEEGITTGTSATTFDPNGKCARAIVVTFLWRAAGSPEPTTTENPFTDVKESDFYYKAVLWAVEKGITTGTSATTFSPSELCNRATVVTFLYRAMGSPAVSSSENPFSDVKVDSWYGPAVLWAVENGITNGMGDGTFGVGASCTRAQVVTFLYRTLVN